jgi:hypothetical protein
LLSSDISHATGQRPLVTAEIHGSLTPAERYCLGMAPTTSDPSTGLRGRFWLQGNSEGEGTSGRLILVAGSDPLLELDELLTPLTRETGRRKLPDGRELVTSSLIPPQEWAGQSLTIYGALQTGELVTLPSAFTAGFTSWGTGYQSHRLQAFYALLGDHVDGADALFTRVRLRIRHLDAWANLPGFTLTPDLAAGRYTLAFEKPQVLPAALAGGGRVAIEQVTGWEGPGVSGGKLERQVWLDVLDVPPATYREIERTIVKPLVNLLTLSVSAECPIVAVEVSASPDHPWLTVYHAAAKPAAAAIIPLPRILLPLGEVGLPGVATWLDSTGRLGPLPSVVARAAAIRDDPLETQLLELTTAAEGLHRLILPQRKRMTDEQAKEARSKALDAIKELLDDVRDAVQAALTHLTDQSYPRRLLDLAEYVGQAVPGVTGHTVQWKKRVVSTRIGFAHALENGFLNQGNAEESIAILQSLRWLLTGLLLLQTGIDPATLGNRFKDHENYQLFLAQARIWLPAVYEPTENLL